MEHAIFMFIIGRFVMMIVRVRKHPGNLFIERGKIDRTTEVVVDETEERMFL